MLWYAKDITGI